MYKIKSNLLILNQLAILRMAIKCSPENYEHGNRDDNNDKVDNGDYPEHFPHVYLLADHEEHHPVQDGPIGSTDRRRVIRH